MSNTKYYEFYGLTHDPFPKNAMLGHQTYESRDFYNATEQLKTGAERNGVIVITALPGLGKSLTIDRFLTSLDTTKHFSAYVCPAFVSPVEFYRMVATALGLDPTGNKQRLIMRIKAHVLSSYKRGRSLVLVIDEAQDLKMDILKELHIFLNYERDSVDACTLILTGNPMLNEIIDTKECLAALKQRVTNHYDYLGLSDNEIPLYLKHKLEFAGGSNVLIEDEAIRDLLVASRGVSRVIDHIMTDALAYGAMKKRTTIDAEIMQFAIDNQSLVARKRFTAKGSSSKMPNAA